MSSSEYIFKIPPFHRAKQKNRKYWKLQEILHEDYKVLPSGLNFDPINELDYSWMCIIGFVDMAHYRRHAVLRPSEWFEIDVIGYVKDTQFDVRVGIVRKSGKEIAVSNAGVISPEKHTAELRLIHRSKFLKTMLSYKELEFFVERNEKDEESEENKKFYIQKFRTGYKELLLSGRISDFTINVKAMKFEVHRSILGARSPVFSAMMEHEMKEKRNGEVSIIDADPAVFKEFLFYLYTGDEEQLDWNNVAELYELADKYLVEDLKYLSVKRMKTHISIENFVKIFYISQQLNNSELSEGVIQFFLEDEKEITASEKYIEFAKKHCEETYILEKALKADIETQ